MFPQLIAGPIVQYKTIDEQLRAEGDSGAVREGRSPLYGRSWQKKCCWRTMRVCYGIQFGLDLQELPVLTAWVGLAAYTRFNFILTSLPIRIWRSALEKCSGFHFLENFNYPYISKSITGSGGAGTFPLAPGSRIMCIYRSAATR